MQILLHKEQKKQQLMEDIVDSKIDKTSIAQELGDSETKSCEGRTINHRI